jgi:hypothetical protein
MVVDEEKKGMTSVHVNDVVRQYSLVAGKRRVEKFVSLSDETSWYKS